MPRLTDDLTQAADWLISIRDEELGGWGEYQGSNVNSLNTAEAILALVATGRCSAGDAVIQEARRLLESRQAADGEHAGAWSRSVETPEGQMVQIPDTVRTALALLALNAAGGATADPPIARGLEWLLKTQNADKGWGYSAGRGSQLFPTCLVLQAALRMLQAGGAADAPGLTQTMSAAQDGLVTTYARGDGSFGNLAGLEMVHTLTVLKTLGQAQGQGFPAKAAVMDAARRWVRQRPADATRWANETIQLTADEWSQYTFTHITPALYLEAMADDPPASPATREALVVIADNVDTATGAFGSRRPVSWSTAKTLLGLAAVKETVAAFPERNPPPAPRAERLYLFLGILLLALVATGVNLFGRLSGEYIGLLSLIIFALLLVYGALSEGSFVELVKSLTPGGKKKEGG